MKKVLIVEDDKLIADLERDFLFASGYEADCAMDGRKGLQLFDENDYDAVLLDVMVPQIDGINLCRIIREKSNVPVIMVTAKKEDIDKIKGLAVGADDYVVKPFSPTELVARVNAHIGIHEKLRDEYQQKELSNEMIIIKNLKIDISARRVFKDEKEVFLTNKEFELLQFFLDNPHIALSKEKIFDRVWGWDAVGDVSTVTVHVNRLRDKIEQNPSDPTLIQTVWGLGYRFEINV